MMNWNQRMDPMSMVSWIAIKIKIKNKAIKVVVTNLAIKFLCVQTIDNHE